MERGAFFVAGFASGWAVRTTVDSSRGLAVKVLAGFYGIVDRTSRAVGMEREHLEDLLAEARAKYEADRDRVPSASEKPKAGRGTTVPFRGRAA